MAFLITTTGTLSPVVFNDLGGLSYTHPIVSYDLSLPADLDEIRESADVQAAITAGHITVVDEFGKAITNVGSIYSNLNITRGEINVPGQMSTNSTTYVAPVGTPAFTVVDPGDYLIMVHTTISSSAPRGGANSYLSDLALFNSGVLIPNSSIQWQREYDIAIVPLCTKVISTFTAGQVFDVRIRVNPVSATHTVRIDNTTLTYIKVS